MWRNRKGGLEENSVGFGLGWRSLLKMGFREKDHVGISAKPSLTSPGSADSSCVVSCILLLALDGSKIPALSTAWCSSESPSLGWKFQERTLPHCHVSPVEPLPPPLLTSSHSLPLQGHSPVLSLPSREGVGM